QKTVAAARQQGADWTVVDGYHFTNQWQHAVRDAGLRLLVFDDHGQIGCHFAEIVVDPNLAATADRYPACPQKTRPLPPPPFTLPRRVRRWPEWRRECPPVGRHILVTLGGSDPGNAAVKIIQALDRIRRPQFEAVVLVGPANPHRAELEAAVRQSRAMIDLRES